MASKQKSASKTQKRNGFANTPDSTAESTDVELDPHLRNTSGSSLNEIDPEADGSRTPIKNEDNTKQTKPQSKRENSKIGGESKDSTKQVRPQSQKENSRIGGQSEKDKRLSSGGLSKTGDKKVSKNSESESGNNITGGTSGRDSKTSNKNEIGNSGKESKSKEDKILDSDNEQCSNNTGDNRGNSGSQSSSKINSTDDEGMRSTPINNFEERVMSRARTGKGPEPQSKYSAQRSSKNAQREGKEHAPRNVDERGTSRTSTGGDPEHNHKYPDQRSSKMASREGKGHEPRNVDERGTSRTSNGTDPEHQNNYSDQRSGSKMASRDGKEQAPRNGEYPKQPSEEDDEDYINIKVDYNDEANDLTDEGDDYVPKDDDAEEYNTPQPRRKNSSKRRPSSSKQTPKSPHADTKQSQPTKPNPKPKTPRQRGVRNKEPYKEEPKQPKQPTRTRYTGMYSRKQVLPPSQRRNPRGTPLSPRSTSSQRSSVLQSRSTNKSQLISSRKANAPYTTKNSKDNGLKLSNDRDNTKDSTDNGLKPPKGSQKPQSSLAAFNSPKERADIEIFKAKEPLFYHAFAWNEEVFRELVHCGIFSEDELYSLKEASAPRERYTVLLEALRAGDGMEDLQALALSLMKNNVDISHEITAEIELANGELFMEERMTKEASRLVHMQFGMKRRLTEDEKRMVSKLLAERNQIMKHIWEKKTMKLTIDTKREEERGQELDDVIKRLSHDLHDYVTNNMPGDIPPRDRIATDGPTVSSGYPDHNPDAGVLEGTVINMCDQIVGIGDDVIEARNERYRTVHDVLDLKIDADQANMKELFEKALLAALARKEEQAAKIAEMDEMLAALEAEERREARVIEKLHLYREKDMTELERAIPRSKHHLQELNDELKRLRRQVCVQRDGYEDEIMRAESLEKGSRINSIYRKDTEMKTGKKVKVSSLKILEDKDEDEEFGLTHSDVTRTLGSKLLYGGGPQRKMRSAELVEDLDIL